MPYYPLALELTLLLVFWVTLGAWERDAATPGRRTFALLALAVGAWCLGELLLQHGAVGGPTAARVRYLGILSLPGLWLALGAHALRLELVRRVPWLPAVLLVPLAAPYALLYSETWSGLFVRALEGGAEAHGPLWSVCAVYGHAMVLVGCALLFGAGVHWWDRLSWTRRAALCLAPLAPPAGALLEPVVVATGGPDATPILYGLALVPLRAALLPGGLLDALPLSQIGLIEQLPLGVLVTDRRGVVVHMNHAAEERLELPSARAVGRNLDSVLVEAGVTVCADFSPLFSNGREVGQLVLLDASKRR